MTFWLVSDATFYTSTHTYHLWVKFDLELGFSSGRVFWTGSPGRVGSGLRFRDPVKIYLDFIIRHYKKFRLWVSCSKFLSKKYSTIIIKKTTSEILLKTYIKAVYCRVRSPGRVGPGQVGSGRVQQFDDPMRTLFWTLIMQFLLVNTQNKKYLLWNFKEPVDWLETHKISSNQSGNFIDRHKYLNM